MKVLFVLPRMVAGGVEHVTLRLVNHFQCEGITCGLALRKCSGELLVEAQSVAEVHELAPTTLLQFVPRLKSLIATWRPTHIITAFTDVAVMTRVAAKLARSDAKMIHGVHNTHNKLGAEPSLRGYFRHILYNAMAGFIYHRADAIVVVSKGLGEEVRGKYRISENRVHTIYNPVVEMDHVQFACTGPSLDGKGVLKLVALGRLVRQKGFDLLIEAMSLVNMSRPWELCIWGEGPQRSELVALINKYGLQEHIHLCGYTSTPMEVLGEANIFILPSRHEGLANVLIEAMACKLQLIAADCPHGPREILQNGRLGWLIPPCDVNALATAVMASADTNQWVDAQLLQEAAMNFSISRSGFHWVRLLKYTMYSPHPDSR